MQHNTFAHWLLRFTSVAGIFWALTTLIVTIPNNQIEPYHPVVLGVAILFLTGFIAYLLIDGFQWYIAKQKINFDGWTEEEREQWKHMSNAEKAKYEQEIADLMRVVTNETPVPRKSIPEAIRRLVLERDAYICSYCQMKGEPTLDPDGLSWHIDHVMPVSRGGKTVPQNLTLSCTSCNLAKGAKTPVEFMKLRQKQGRWKRWDNSE